MVEAVPLPHCGSARLLGPVTLLLVILIIQSSGGVSQTISPAVTGPPGQTIGNTQVTSINPSQTSNNNPSLTMTSSVINSSVNQSSVSMSTFTTSSTRASAVDGNLTLSTSASENTTNLPTLSLVISPTVIVMTSSVKASSSAIVQPSPTDKLDNSSSSTPLPLSLGAIIGIAVGGVVFFLLIIVCLFCCWYLCFHVSGYEYRTGSEDLQYRLTVHYKTTGSANHMARQDSLASSFRSRISSMSRSRISSIRSSLGMKARVHKDKREGEVHENETALPQYSTPV